MDMVTKKIALLPGDGIGPEVCRQAVKVLDAVAERFGHRFEFTSHLVGACAIEASAIGAPISCDIAFARSGIRALYSVMIRPSTSSRSCTLVWLQRSNAERAAATALSTSAPVPSVISVQGCSVDGSIT